MPAGGFGGLETSVGGYPKERKGFQGENGLGLPESSERFRRETMKNTSKHTSMTCDYRTKYTFEEV